MIAVDTSSLVAFINGEESRDTALVNTHLEDSDLYFPPLVVTEILSSKDIPVYARNIILSTPRLQIFEGYWERAADSRAKILNNKLKCRIADALIAQSCIDHKVALITRDKDFRHFAKYCGLRIAT